MPNSIPVLIHDRIIALALGHPGKGPAAISSELAREKNGGFRVSANGVYRLLRRHGLQTRVLRNGLLADYAVPPDPVRDPEPERHIEVDHPGGIVQFDCFCVGRLAGTNDVLWQYAAIDATSSFTWAELHVTPRNPACASARSSPSGSRKICAMAGGSSSARRLTTAQSSATTVSMPSSMSLACRIR